MAGSQVYRILILLAQKEGVLIFVFEDSSRRSRFRVGLGNVSSFGIPVGVSFVAIVAREFFDAGMVMEMIFQLMLVRERLSACLKGTR